MFDFLLAVGGLLALVFVVAFLLEQKRINSPKERAKREAADERERQFKEEVAAAREAKDNWFNTNFSRYDHKAMCTAIGSSLSDSLAIAIDSDHYCIRIVGYKVFPEFEIVRDKNLPLRNIISLDITRPTVFKTVTKTQAVPIVSSKKKSPVLRGVAGGVLLGPAGLILGAASGVGNNISTKVEERKIKERVEKLGDPELAIGTSLVEDSMIKIRFSPASLAEEWVYKIRAAQAATA